jgi:prevent-host-death family protein
MRTIAAGQFKAKCLAILDEVKESGEAVVVTKRGKPVARVESCEAVRPPQAKRSLLGFMRGMVTIPEGVDLVSSDFDEKEWLDNWDRVERESRK